MDILARDHGTLTIVDLVGELDLRSATRLVARLSSLACAGSRVVVCDLSRLSLAGAPHVLMAFPTAQRRSGAWPQTSIRLAAPTVEVASWLWGLGMRRFLPVHGTLQEALGAAEGDAAAFRRDLVLTADPASSRWARRALTDFWPQPHDENDIRQDGLIVVGELASNAARFARAPFQVSMAASRTRFLIGVTDDSQQLPRWRPESPSVLTGRGLRLVESLSQQWGVRLVYPRGKTVWASLDRHRDSPRMLPRLEPV